MILKVDGEEVSYADPMTISELITDRKVKMPEMVSVALNGRIIRQNAFEETKLKEGDQVAVDWFRAGGGRNRRAE